EELLELLQVVLGGRQSELPLDLRHIISQFSHLDFDLRKPFLEVCHSYDPTSVLALKTKTPEGNTCPVSYRARHPRRHALRLVSAVALVLEWGLGLGMKKPP